MEDQTQAVSNEEREVEEESDIRPVGYLRVLTQKDLEQVDHPLQEGELTLGRGSECEVVIPARSLSRKHATVLVEGGTHFIQDLDSRNKTYRGTVQLRPNAFYELTHGCKLTFADIKCVYYINSLPEEEEGEGEGEAAANEEATQAYSVNGGGEEERDDGGTAAEDDAGGKDNGEETDDEFVNAEPTQAYNLDGGAGEEEEEEEEGEPMDCEQTVAYNITDEAENHSDDDGEGEDKEEESPPSSPILVPPEQLHQGKDETKSESGSTSEAMKLTKKVCFAERTTSGSDTTKGAAGEVSTSKDGEETDGDETNDEEEGSTQPYEEKKEEEGGREEEVKEKESTETLASVKRTDTGAGSVMDIDEVDPTVAYDLETDEDNTDAEEDDKNEGKVEETDGAGAEPTVPYNLKEEGNEEENSDRTDVEEKEVSEKKEASKTVSEASEVAKESVAKTINSSSKNKSGADGVSDDQSEETEDKGDTEKVESSATEPESQEVKEKPAHLRCPRVTRNAKTMSAVSLMDCTDYDGGGGGTVLLESYESSCNETIPLHPTTSTSLIKEATIEMECTANTEEESEEESKENKAGPLSSATLPDNKTVGRETEQVKKEEESDGGSDTLIPELSRVGSKVVSGSTHSKQKTLFDVVSSKRGRGRGRGGRGRGRKTAATRTRDPVPLKTEKLSDGDGTASSKESESMNDLKRESPDVLPCTKAEEDVDGENKATAKGSSMRTRLKALDSLGGISGRVANLRLKTLSCVSPSDVGVSNTTPTPSPEAEGTKVKNDVTGRRGRGRGRKKTIASRQASNAGISPAKTIKDTTSTASIVADTADLLQDEEESPDLPSLNRGDDQSDGTKKSCDHEEDNDNQLEHSLSTTSSTSLELTHSGRGRKRKGRGGASKRGKVSTSTPRRQSTETAAKPRTPSSTPSLRQHRTPSSANRTLSKSPSSSPREIPKIMFTGMIDKDGERTIRELGGELVDSVYQCTHLITDKVRRTVKFLCCLSRGCLIVSDAWLDQCALEQRFLAAGPYLIKDKQAERQHKFSLQRSHESAKVVKLLAGFKVYLTPHVKPEREQMSDIIKCSGGEPLDFKSSLAPGDKVIIVTCEEDLSICQAAMDAGVPVHSTELILGGVLRQDLELHSHLMSPTPPPATSSVAGRKRRAKELSIVPAAKRKRK